MGLTSGNVVTTTGVWHHIAVVRTSGITQLYVNGAQLGGNYVDTNDYAYAALYLGCDFNQGSHWTGHVDNIVVKKGVSDYSTGFTVPTQVDYTENGIVFGLDGEAPFVCSTTDCYATFCGQNSSSATAKSVIPVIDPPVIATLESSRCATRVATAYPVPPVLTVVVGSDCKFLNNFHF